MEKIEETFELLGLKTNLEIQKDNENVFIKISSPLMLLNKEITISKQRLIDELTKYLEWLLK